MRRTAAAGTTPDAALPTPGMRVSGYNQTLFWSAVALALLGIGQWATTPEWSADAWTTPREPAPLLVAVLIATLLAALDPLLFIRIKTERGSMSYGFGEISFVAACFLVPPALLPATTLVGVFCAQMVNLRIGRLPTFSRVLSSAGALALAAAAGAGVVAATDVPMFDALSWPGAAAVAAGAMTFCVVSVLLVSPRIAMTPPTQPFAAVLASGARRKFPMGVCNTAAGLVGITAVSATRWSLLAVPPVVWLLHQTYAYRLRSENERRAWQTFASVVGQFDHVDERGAAAAGLAGVHRLLTAHRAQIVIDGLDGRPTTYELADDGESLSLGAAPPESGAGPPVATRQLLVGGVRIGEIRLLEGPLLTPRELLILNAYGDAFAASLHGATTSTELRVLSQRNASDAEHDAVTGLLNRQAFLRHGNVALNDLDADTPVALLLLDVNHFREINATLGHAAGDDLLRLTAGRLAACNGPGEVLARLGGDEFALLLTGTSASLPKALDRARQLAEALAEPTVMAGVRLSIEASIGVVAVERDDVDMADLVRRADVAMYRAKRDGSTVSSYDAARTEADVDRLALLAELREALAEQDQIYLLLLPAVALTNREPVSVEALVRWKHPRRGDLTPVQFVRAVEQSELLGPFTRHVLDLALAVSARLRGYGIDLPVSVNLSPRSLLDSELPVFLAQLLARHAVPARKLVLEIVETVVISKDPVVDEVLEALHRLGVQLAVDDFGTGCSALTFLTEVPLDEVKIDRSFVTGMADSAEAAAIVRTTVELGKELGLRVVAEGVETEAQRQALIKLGCRLAQGFHFFPPTPVDVMVETLRDAARTPTRPIGPGRPRRNDARTHAPYPDPARRDRDHRPGR